MMKWYGDRGEGDWWIRANSRLRGGTEQTCRNSNDLKVLSVIGHSRGRKNHELGKRRERLPLAVASYLH